MTDTPRTLGYSMPAEWERHEGTWLAWPKNRETFPKEILPGVEAAYKAMVEALAPGEKVRILVDSEQERQRVIKIVGDLTNVEFHTLKTADVWVRDYGPIYVRNGKLAITKWRFNAWGNKYEDLMEDDGAGEVIMRSTGLPAYRPGIVLEGGSIEVNGRGTILTTEQCLLNKNRNPSLGKSEIESKLRDYLGATHVVWLKSGVEGDDTDGHVDDIARFVGPSRALCAVEADPKDPNSRSLEEDRVILEGSTDQDGRKIGVVDLPMPKRVDSPFGRLPASYANFYIGNASVLVPAFGGDEDEEALRIIGRQFPDRKAVGIDCTGLVIGLGTIHCVTQQIPVPP
jgi:agmatine deiminase